MTTRKPREGEKNGTDYFFVDREEFQRLEKSKGLIESAKVFDQFYGTPEHFIQEQLSEGKKIFLTIDVQGTEQIKKTLDQRIPVLTIFVLPPSVKVLRDRLESRQTESANQMELRIQVAQDEIKAAGQYDFTVINQNLDQTINEIETRIEEFLKERRIE